MTSNTHTQFLRFILVPLVLGLALTAFGQEKSEYKKWDFCSNYSYSNGDKVSFKEVREYNVAAGNTVSVDAQRNGGISVKGENRSDVLVRACVQTTGKTDAEAQNIAKNLRVETGSTIRTEGFSDESNWSVSYEILVPLASNLDLTAYNGGISVSSVEGNIKFETTNGGVNVRDTAGDVKGRTKNGGVNVSLSGSSWRGSGLDVETTNGGVNLEIPSNYSARLETGTVNGGIKNNVSGLNFPENGKYGASQSKRITTDLNGGGATIRVVTKNGGVRIGNTSVKVS
jgi:hypothetical protein